MAWKKKEIKRADELLDNFVALCRDDTIAQSLGTDVQSHVRFCGTAREGDSEDEMRAIA